MNSGRPGFFNEHTYKTKLDLTVKRLVNLTDYNHNDSAITAMRRDDCHIDFVVAVHQKMNEHLAKLQSQSKDYLTKIKDGGVLEETLRKFMGGSHLQTWMKDFSADLQSLISSYIKHEKQMAIFEKHIESVAQIIVDKPIMPYPLLPQVNATEAPRPH